MKAAALFSGQGAQTPGMMQEAFENVPGARLVFDIADEVLGRSISTLCFEGTQEELNLTHNTQPCVLAADLAAYESAKAGGLEPSAFAGFSLGEYAALVAAGCISIEDAFRLVQYRADVMQEAVPVGVGAMAAVMRVDAKTVEELCTEVPGYVVCANYNSPAQTVVSGETDSVERLVALCKERKIRAMKIPVSVPAHCELLAPAAEKLSVVLERVEFHDPSAPIYMNVDGLPVTSADGLQEKIVDQVKSPLRWVDTLNNMWADGCSAFVECGPGSTLSGFVKKTLSEAELVAFE